MAGRFPRCGTWADDQKEQAETGEVAKIKSEGRRVSATSEVWLGSEARPSPDKSWPKIAGFWQKIAGPAP
jgi:hypothetical protein